jgi:hypothetical protein
LSIVEMMDAVIRRRTSDMLVRVPGSASFYLDSDGGVHKVDMVYKFVGRNPAINILISVTRNSVECRRL